MALNTPYSEQLFDELEKNLSRLQCNLVALRAHFNPETLSWPQYNVLNALYLYGKLTPSLLSERLSISRANLSKLLKTLKQLNFVEQIPSTVDKRELITCLTDKGLNFLNRAAEGRKHVTQRAQSALTLGEQAIFSELCQKLNYSLEHYNV